MKMLRRKKSAANPAEEPSLFGLLNLRASSEEEKQRYNDEAVLNAITNDPEAISKKYDFKEFRKSYPLIPALCLGASYEVVDFMLNAFPEAVKDRDDILHTVCNGNYDIDAEALDVLIEYCPDAVKKENCKGNTPLHLACESGVAPRVIKVLISKNVGALLQKNNRGETPLHLACGSDASLHVVQILLAKCPTSLWMENCNGRTPLMCAEHWHASDDIVKLLKKWSRPSAA